MSFLSLFAAKRYQITCVQVRKTYKSRQAETKQKSNWKITLRIMSYVLIFSHVARHYKITSKGKAAAFACSVFTRTYCITVIFKALNGVSSFKWFRLNVSFQASNGYLFPICSINNLGRSYKSEFSPELSIRNFETSLFSTIFCANRFIRRLFAWRAARIFVLTETIHAVTVVPR